MGNQGRGDIHAVWRDSNGVRKIFVLRGSPLSEKQDGATLLIASGEGRLPVRNRTSIVLPRGA